MAEHTCPRCGNSHDGNTNVFTSRCSNCGALNGESAGDCRKCGQAVLVALDDIPDAVGRYPGLTKTDRGYEVVAAN